MTDEVTTEALNALGERAVVALERIAGVLAGQTAPKVSDETLVADRAIGMGLRAVAAKHGVGVGRVRGADTRAQSERTKMMSDEPQAEALKPCPFCGGAAEIEPKNWAGRDRIGVFCTECGIFQDSREPTDEGAIAVWNTRASPSEEMVDALASAFTEGATSVHNEWAKAGTEDRRYLERNENPDFAEAASDHARAILKAMES